MNIAGLKSAKTFLLLPKTFLPLPMAAALGLAVLASLSSPSVAQNRGTPEQQQACQPDALRLCSEYVPDVERITACMIKNRMRLSAPCRAVFTSPPHGKSFRRSS